MARGAGRSAEVEAPAGSLPVSLAGVTKRYRGGRGIEDVDLQVAAGEVFAFLGPNGAGKTTTIRVMLDLIRPDAGSVRLFGLDVRSHSVDVRRRIGYLPGELGLYEHLTARELLTHFAHLRGGPPWSVTARLCEVFDLELDKVIGALSKGNRQKVGLVQALMGEPDLLILDEPTSGLDPLVQAQVHDAIRRAALGGRSVFLSSHILSEVAGVASRVGIIKDGRMVGVERVSDLRRRAVHYVDVRFAGGIRPPELTGLAGVEVLAPVDDRVHLAVSGSLDPVLAVLASHPVEDLLVREPDLEDVLLSIIRGGRRAARGTGDLAGARR